MECFPTIWLHDFVAGSCSLFAQAPSSGNLFIEHTLNGITFGMLIALIALGYTMVYGIIGMINFAHGDVFMLGCFLSLTLLNLVFRAMGIHGADSISTAGAILGIALSLIVVPIFCGALNTTIDYTVYKPLRNAPKLAPLVSAIGVSFVLMNLGQLWGGPADINFPNLIPNVNVCAWIGLPGLQYALKDFVVLLVTLPIMLALTYLVKFTKLGKSMRAVEQNPVAAQLMGINSDRVIAATFAIGGALGGVASAVYCLNINTISYQMGFQNGLYAFTAAVLGGIGKLPGAVLGGLLIGLVRSYTSAYIGEQWTNAMIFAVLIAILVFRPAGLLGSTARDKV